MTSSLTPGAREVIKEAGRTSVSISLLLLFAAMGVSYWAGRDAAAGVSEAKQTIQDERSERMARAQEEQARKTEIIYLGFQKMQGDVAALRAQLEETKSHCKQRNEK